MIFYKTFALLIFCCFGNCSSINRSSDGKCDIETNKRFDCFPVGRVTQQTCEQRGCCWKPVSTNMDVPYCFYGSSGVGYDVCGHRDTDTGFEVDLCLAGSKAPYPGTVEKLVAQFRLETYNRLRVKIIDPVNKRYEVPTPSPDVKKKVSFTNFKVTYKQQPFSFTVTRKSTGQIIFDTGVGGFIYSDQFLQISTLLPTKDIYGLGEHVMGLKLDTNWKTLSLFARDVATPEGGINLYGVHPFYVNMENDGAANGVFLKNSNAMDIILQPTPAITYRTIGGILDFYIFLGPTVNDVVSQYTDVVGKPVMPPYWAMGFHLCRWGYNTLDNMQQVREAMKSHRIPQDVQWNDIDYMENYLDFTVDQKRFKGLGSFVDQLHKDGMHYILMTDPAISSTHEGYAPYEIGVKENIFVKDAAGDILLGKVWPGYTAFPDFFNPNTTSYWLHQIENFHNQVKFDGLWIDMNEPSNFVDGSTKGCPDSKYENPPYATGILGGKLRQKTICMTSQQHAGIHYDLHSLYGHSEAVATMSSLKKILGKRSVVISRSTYAGTGHHAGHWLGDNHSTWEDLYRSIAGILNFNLFGVPLVGADICGFQGDTTEELCSRWMQLGAFYPFSRNHNDLTSRAQGPTAFGTTLTTASRNALNDRYMLLPYLYTLFYQAHIQGTPVARSLFAVFSEDKSCYDIDRQFMWGDGLLISPVLEKGAKSVEAYFPKAVWYDFHTGASRNSSGAYVELGASMEYTNLHVKGGIILPTQQPALTTTKSRMNDFGLIVALDSSKKAKGVLYLDDGESLLENGNVKSSIVIFQCSKNELITSSFKPLYKPPHDVLSRVVVLGVTNTPSHVTVNGVNTPFSYDEKLQILRILELRLSIIVQNAIKWS